MNKKIKNITNLSVILIVFITLSVITVYASSQTEQISKIISYNDNSDTFTIDSELNIKHQPIVSAYTEAKQTIPSSTDKYFNISFDKSSSDTGITHSDYIFKIRKDGIYYIYGKVVFDKNANGFRATRIINNGNVLSEDIFKATSDDVSSQSISSMIVKLYEDDEIVLQALQNSGKELAIENGKSKTFLTLYKLG